MATNLTTQQKIKVKVNQENGALVPQNKQPVVLKNTVQQTVGVGGLGNVNEGTPAQGGTLVFNSETQLYDVRSLTLRDMGDLGGSPSNGDIIIYSASANAFFYGTAPKALADLTDVDTTPRANGSVLTYDSNTNTYIHAVALTNGGTVNAGTITVNNGVVVTSISDFANTTQLGSANPASNTELVTARAIKDYVDTVVNASGGGGGGGAVNLDGLLDVTLGGVEGLINRQVLLYDGASSHWVNRQIVGQANNIRMDHTSNNDIVIALANAVAIQQSLTVPTANVGTLTVTGTAVVGNNATISGSLGVGQQLAVARAASFSNTVTVAGNVHTGSNLSVNGSSTFTNTVTIRANASVGQQLTTNNVLITGELITNGPVTIGNESANLTINAKLDSDIIPAANNVYSLGSPGMRFKDIYVSATTLVIGDVILSAADGVFSINTDMVVEGSTTYAANVAFSGGIQVAQTALLYGNVVIGSNTSDRVAMNGLLNTSIIPYANVSYSLGNTTNRFATVFANNITAVGGNFSGDVVVSGNLVVQGELTEVSVTTMAVEDPLIQLSANNTSDTIDIGFYGAYNNGTTRYTGLFRDASDGGKFVLFANTVAAPTTVVSRTSPSFQVATLVSYVESGGLISNASTISITGNSTVSVGISANTLSLTTALGSASGGTGRTTLTQNAVLVGNGTSAVKQITASQEMQVLSIVGGIPTFVSSLDAGEY